MISMEMPLIDMITEEGVGTVASVVQLVQHGSEILDEMGIISGSWDSTNLSLSLHFQ